MELQRRVIDIGFKVLNKTHKAVLVASGGHVGKSAFGNTMVELHTIGRKSGVIRSTMLLAPIVEDGRIVVVASKGGDDRDPDWYRNLVAHPDVEVTVGAIRHSMRARRATEEEANELWPLVTKSYKPYASYRKRTQRDIPLVICEPRSAN
jgi:deazaflavin-dependent oxidoreductase (nitroreductase family)